MLAVVGSNLPTALRAFLLTLAVVDDLIVIVIIAVFYTSSLELTALGLAAVAFVVWAAAAALPGPDAARLRAAGRGRPGGPSTRAASTPRSPASCSVS